VVMTAITDAATRATASATDAAKHSANYRG
jgi:hypothetical protein